MVSRERLTRSKDSSERAEQQPQRQRQIFRQRIAVLSVVYAPPQLYAGLRKPPQHPVFNQFEVRLENVP